MAIDLGAHYVLSPSVKLGMSLLNLNQPDIGLKGTDKVPLVTRFGALYQKKYLKATAELTNRAYLNSAKDTRLLLGAERFWLFGRYGTVAVRGGIGLGNRNFKQMTLGLGYDVNGIGLDYVFTIPP